METRGLLIGKFAPLHRGHEFIIAEAQRSCNELILLSYSIPDFVGIPAWKRSSWLQQVAPKAKALAFDHEDLKQFCLKQKYGREIPTNSASDSDQQHFATWLYINQINKPLDFIFTSESYGDSFTSYISSQLTALQKNPAQHICVDIERSRFDFSGTKARKDDTNWTTMLAPFVHDLLIPRIVFLGAESTGKSTLVELLSQQFNSPPVLEFGRDLWVERQGKLSFEDMSLIGRTQIDRENKALAKRPQVVFCDTSPLTTYFYCTKYFGKTPSDLSEFSNRQYDLVFLCEPDFPLVQDGTRMDEKFRQEQHAWYLKTLSERKIQYTRLSGSLEVKVHRAKSEINSLLKNWLKPIP